MEPSTTSFADAAEPAGSADVAGRPTALPVPASEPLPAVDPARLARTRALFDEPLDDLLDAAGAAAADAARRMGPAADPVGASPVILTGACATQPPCRHCKWEHFKAVGRSAFVLDMTREQVLARAQTLVDHGVRRAFTATGWMGYRLPKRFVDHVAAIREAQPSLELYGLFGAIDLQSCRDLAAAGMTGVLCGLESPSQRVYRSFRPGGDSLADRLRSLDFARSAGLALWSGFLVGLGETADDCAYGIELLRSLEPESVSILPFEPYPDTPMAACPACDPAWLARVNAVARLALPGVAHFFADHAEPFEGAYVARLGMNGTYETGVR